MGQLTAHAFRGLCIVGIALLLPLQSGAALTLGRSRSVHRRTESISYDRDADVGASPVVLVSPLLHSDDLLPPPASHPPTSSFAFVDFESSSSSEDEAGEGEEGFISAAPPDYSDVVPSAPPARPLSMPPVESAGRERPDVTSHRASAYVLAAEPVPVVRRAARTPPTQRQEPGFVYDPDDGYQYYMNFIKVGSVRVAC